MSQVHELARLIFLEGPAFAGHVGLGLGPPALPVQQHQVPAQEATWQPFSLSAPSLPPAEADVVTRRVKSSSRGCCQIKRPRHVRVETSYYIVRRGRTD